MDKQSFASVYRTAAVLAAFSRADGAAPAPSAGGPSPVFVAGVATSGWKLMVKRMLDFLTVIVRAWCRAPASDAKRAFDTVVDPFGRWMSQRPMAVPSPPVAEPGRPLVSHFAFCDEPELHRPGPKL